MIKVPPAIIPVQYPALKLTNANMQLTTDQAFTWLIPNVPSQYVLRRVVAVLRSGAFSVACAGGIYTATAKGGNALVAAAQSWANLTGANKIVDATMAAVNGTDATVASTLYLSLTTGNSAALVADLYGFIDVLSP
jgi:hypothetical protein